MPLALGECVQSGQTRADLQEIIDDRSACKATIITSQLPIEHWNAWIGDAAIADAILDRIMQRNHCFTRTGYSLRQKPKSNKSSPNQIHLDRHYFNKTAQRQTAANRSRSPERSVMVTRTRNFDLLHGTEIHTQAGQMYTSGVLQHAGAPLQHVHGKTGDRPVGLRCSAIPFEARTCIPALKFYVVEPINKSPSINY